MRETALRGIRFTFVLLVKMPEATARTQMNSIRVPGSHHLVQTWGWIAPPPHGSHDNFGDDARADRPAALPNGEVAPDVEVHRLIQADDDSGRCRPASLL